MKPKATANYCMALISAVKVSLTNVNKEGTVLIE
jgi:hypothetical protein